MKYISRPHILFAAIMIALLWSCERRPLEDDIYTTARIPIRIYWDKAAQGLPAGEWSVQNATALVYDSEGVLYLEKQFESLPQYAETLIELPLGEYTVVVFNELRDQIENVSIRGYERLSTLQAHSTPSPARINTRSRASGDLMVTQPGHLAAITVSFSVTAEVITRTRAATRTTPSDVTTLAAARTLDQLLDLHPARKTTLVHLTAHLQKLNNALMPALVDLRNMSEAYEFATDRNTKMLATTQFTMNNREYNPGSTTDGTIHETVTTFGLPGIRESIDDLATPILLEFLFKLIDNHTLVPKSFDITQQMVIHRDENAAIEITLDLDAGPLPKVDNIGEITDLIDWTGEEINIEL